MRLIHVKVGCHIAPAPEDLDPLLDRLASAYGNEKLPKIQRIIGVAASHHRLLWIHPFADGNERVARLYSHAFLRELGIGSSLWPVSRGLARAVDKYKAALQAADEPRRGDLDGRGNLTQAGLVALLAGEFSRSKASVLTDIRTARRERSSILSLKKGVLVSPTSRSAVRLGFPVAVVDRWFPRLCTGPASST